MYFKLRNSCDKSAAVLEAFAYEIKHCLFHYFKGLFFLIKKPKILPFPLFTCLAYS